MRKVCHLTSVHHLYDTRIFYKQCISLAKRYEVVLVGQNGDGLLHEGVMFAPLAAFPTNRIARMLWGVPAVIRQAFREKADVYHIHDPELMPGGWILKLFGKRVIYDVHEDYPRDILGKEWIWPPLRNLIAAVVKLTEAISFRLFDAVVPVTEDISRYFKGDKCYIVHNYPRLDLIDAVASRIKEDGEKPIIYYAGDLSVIRGVVTLVEAMAMVSSEAELWLAGPWENDSVRSQCENSAGWAKCRYLGKLSFRDAIATMKSASIGVVPFKPHGNHFNALPNKAFEYMSCSLPMVLSDFPFWRQYFGAFGSFYDPMSSKALAEQLDFVLSNWSIEKERAVKARQFVEDNRSWEAEEKVLFKMYEKILG